LLLFAQTEQTFAAMSTIAARYETVVPGRLHHEFGERQNNSCEDVYGDLLIHGAVRCTPMTKDPVAAKQTGQGGMEIVFFAPINVLQEQTSALVQQSKFGEVHGVLPCRFEDEPELLTNGSGAEEEDHDEGVREADFGAVDGAIADGFEKDERLVVFGVEDDFAFDVVLVMSLGPINCVVTRTNGILEALVCST
jgi:hypothetical protein